jgi:16S rRNA (cytosine967-C5)-methyltransferase
MVNAVLRNVDRAGAMPLPEDDGIAALSIRYSHPEWLVRAWSQQLGLDAAKALLEADQVPAPITLRIRDGDVAGAEEFFSELDIAAEPARYAPHALRITGGGNPQEWGPVGEGRWVLQDEAAQLMASLLPHADRHLDLCAAPGGKAFCLADRDPRAEIVAVESEAARVNDMRTLAEKLGLTARIALEQGDARRPVAGGEKFPSVLVDAPCSGLGTLRRNPDRKWKPQPPAELPKLQLVILRQAARQTQPGGHLLYVTCTIWAPENEGVVQAFEREHEGWQRVKADHPFLSEDGLYRSRPDLHGTDGFFGALWRAPA